MFRNFLLKQNISQNTIISYTYWINRMLKQIDGRVTQKKIINYKEMIMIKYSVNTQKIVFSALNLYLKYSNIMLSFSIPKANFIIKGRSINYEEYLDMLDNCMYEDFYINIRNKEVLKILWALGLRACELLNLEWKNIKDSYILICSKHNVSRKIPYKKGLFDILFRYKKESSWVICNNAGDKLSYSYIYKLIKELNPQISPHSFRHSYATRLLHNGIPLNYVSKLLGHSNLNTTLNYLHTDQTYLIKLLEKNIWDQEK